MNVLHLNESDILGGAARAAHRLHCGLKGQGVPSRMLVRAKGGTDSDTFAERSFLTKLGPPSNGLLLNFLHSGRERYMFSAQWLPDVISSKVNQLEPDIVHIHWICNGFIRLENLAKVKAPLVWTLHDMWPFTGGCHYVRGCDRYQVSCGSCPQLKSSREQDLSRFVWWRKLKAWKALNLTLISPSYWMADCAKSSPLFKDTRIEVIPHGLDLEQFRPIQKRVAQDLLRLPKDRRIILFGASSGVTDDPRKGFQFLQAALKRLGEVYEDEQLAAVIFGIAHPEQPLELGVDTYYLGRLSDDLTLTLAYASADVMVVPSMYEAFGQTASEALACGTPVVAFKATGLKDIVTHEKDGYLAEPYEADDLMRGLLWVLEDTDRHQKLCHHAREKAMSSFSLALQAQRHISLYEEILNNR